LGKKIIETPKKSSDRLATRLTSGEVFESYVDLLTYTGPFPGIHQKDNMIFLLI